MSLVSQLQSLKSGLGSLASAVSDLGVETLSGESHNGADSFSPLFDFLKTASAAGLKQYTPDIAEESLLGARLGDGTDYVVDKVQDSKGDVVVVKHVKVSLPPDGTARDADGDDISRVRKVLHEVRIATHPALRCHANILQIRGFGWELGEGSSAIPFLVVEYAEHGTLLTYLQTGYIDTDKKLRLASGAASALQVLHNHNICHGDLKLENVLVLTVPADPTVKVTDFGLSVVLGDDNAVYEYWGTDHYRPPEVQRQTGGAPTAGLIRGSNYRACDIYTYGLLVLEILLGGKSYLENAQEDDEVDEQCEGLQRLSDVVNTNDGNLSILKSLVERCLRAEVETRPSIRQLVSDLSGEDSPEDEEDIAPLTLGEVTRGDMSGIIGLNETFATLGGFELHDESAHLAPWAVQEVVVESLRAQADHRSATIASQASLELGVCHLLGFGVERDETKVLQYIDQAAAKGCFEARRIRQRLYQAFEKSLIPLSMQARLDEQEERQIQRILAAEVQNLDANPFRLFDDVVQDDFRAREQSDVLTLHEAAYIGLLVRLETLLTNMLDYRDDQGRTALFLAVQGGHIDAVKVLLERGRSDPSLPDEDGHTALHMLIMMGTAEVEEALTLMLEAAPELDLNVFSSSTMDATEHWTELWGAPLHWAVLGGNKAMTAALVRAGARVHGWPEDSCPIRLTASLHLSEILELLLAALPSGFSLDGSNPLFALNASNPFRRLLLHGKDHISQIRKTVSLLTKHWPILDKGEEQWNGNPLKKILVVNFSATDRHIAAALVAAEADQDSYDGLTLLQAAIIGCHGSPVSSVCRMALDIIDLQPDLGRQSADYRSGWTALHWSAAGGTVPVARKLLEVDPSSINARTQEEENRTPLHLAAEAGKSLPMIKLLLERGADASLTTSSLKVTPLGSFVSNQRGELNLDILKALLHASANAGYLVLGSDKWNVLHYAATRAALLDAESLPGHLLLRALVGIPEIQSLIESTTSQGWTPLHLASYLVDFTTIKLLVDHFHADVQARTPGLSASAFDIVLERARQYPSGLRGTDSRARWSRLAYRSALFLQKKLEALEGPYHLTPLHLAAYVGYYDEVLRIVHADPHTVFETNYEGETPREILLNTLPSDRPEE